MKVFFRRIHLYLGLIAGLVIFNTCLTGTLLVFQDEIELMINHELYYVKPAATRLPISQLTEKVNALQPGVKIQNVRVFNHPDRSVEITYQLKGKGKKDGKAEGKEGGRKDDQAEGKPNEHSDAKSETTVAHLEDRVERGGEERTGHKAKERPQAPGAEQATPTATAQQEEGKDSKGEGKAEGAKTNKKGGKGGKREGKKDDNFRAYIDPYTGNVISIVENKKTFYYKVLFLHRQLLAGETGKIITGTSATIFVFIIITGLILWWPSKRNLLKQKLTIKRHAGWKRTMHDWHTVLGFYACIFLFISALTGVVIAFKWASNTIFYVTNSPLQNPEPPKSAAPFDKEQRSLAMDKALATAFAEYPGAVMYQLNMPKGDSAAMAVNVLKPGKAYKNMTDALYFDQYTGMKTGGMPFEERSKGAIIRSYMLPLHTGSIMGMPSRIIALFVMVIGASLPVTGVVMWINRIRKRKGKKVLQPHG